MAQRVLGAERWAAIRALREGQTPTYPLLARAAGVHEETVKKQGLRGKWAHPSATGNWGGGAAADGLEKLDALAAPAEADGSPEERLERMLHILMREVERIGAAAQAMGRVPDKTRMDAVWSMIRMLEKVEEFLRARAGGIQAKRDEEMGDVLKRIDARIEELARAYAQELVRVEFERIGSAADPGRMAAERAA